MPSLKSILILLSYLYSLSKKSEEAQYHKCFVFNTFLLKKLSDKHFKDFTKEVIYGLVSIDKFQYPYKEENSFIIISRRDCRRLGKKLITRGLDP